MKLCSTQLFVALFASFLCAFAANGQTTNVRQALSRFIRALQGTDYSVIVAAYEPCALEIDEIKRENPRILWPSKVSHWRALLVGSTETESAKNPGKIVVDRLDFNEYADLGVFGAAAPAELNMLFNLFPKTATWRIAEVRPGNYSDGRSFFDAFISVVYPGTDKAPKMGSRPLAKTIVEFRVSGPPLFHVGDPLRIVDADELAPEPH